jgi:ketosteroid isomerase-like protein
MRNSVLMILALTSCTPAGPTFTDADKAAIMEQRAAFTAAVNAADWDKAVAVYTDDAVAMAPNAPTSNGRLSIRDGFASMPPMGDFKTTGEQFLPAGDQAVIRGGYVMNLMPPGAPAAIADTGKFVEVWRRQGDGSWKLAIDIWSSDRPAEAFLPPPAK